MKKIILSILAACVLIQVVYSQTSVNTQVKPLITSADTLKLMNHIDSVVQQIKNNINGYTENLLVKDSTGSSYEYVKDYDLREVKLDCKDPRDNNYKKVDWYFENGKEIYSESVWTDASGKTIHTDKVYVYNEQLIAWFDTGKKVSSNSPSFKELIPQVASYAVALTKEANDVAKGLPAIRSSNVPLYQWNQKK